MSKLVHGASSAHVHVRQQKPKVVEPVPETIELIVEPEQPIIFRGPLPVAVKELKINWEIEDGDKQNSE